MIEELTLLISGIVFGLIFGLSPGPTLTLVTTETLKHDKKEGIKIAVAPIITDLPIILITFLILSQLSSFNPILGIISIFGAIFIGDLGFESISVKKLELNARDVKPQSLRKVVIANFLNPHPYVFWFVVGAPTVLKTLDVSLYSAVLFTLGFYVFLVGSKIAVAFIAQHSRSFLKSNTYIYAIRILGVLLLFFALMFLIDGLEFFELI